MSIIIGRASVLSKVANANYTNYQNTGKFQRRIVKDFYKNNLKIKIEVILLLFLAESCLRKSPTGCQDAN